MKYLLLLLLTGCATEKVWYRDMPGYEPKHILVQYVDQPTLQAVCAKKELLAGCAIRLRDGIDGPTCIIYFGPLEDATTRPEEEKHCRGWGHVKAGRAPPERGVS